MSISTHILNTSTGWPAVHVPVELDRMTDGEWQTLNAGHTDADGRIKYLLPEDEPMLPGIYCARFATGIYYERENVKGLYPYVEITLHRSAGPEPLPHPSAAHAEQLHHVPRKLKS